mgnify:CR=1 FL=1
MKTVGLLLAAGHSRRFGAEDKLLADFRGRPLIRHAADALRAAGFDALVAVVGTDAVAAELGGFTVIRPETGVADQSTSLRAGIRFIDATDANAVVVALADMPLIGAGHLRAVAAHLRSDRPAAATDGKRPMPPAGFPRAMFAALLSSTGDRGARTLLRGLPQGALVAVDPGLLRDIDVPTDLAD